MTFIFVFCSVPQKHPFILMYEERVVDVASYVCKILDQMPASPSSPMYVDWWWPVCWTEYGSATIWCTYSASQNLTVWTFYWITNPILKCWSLWWWFYFKALILLIQLLHQNEFEVDVYRCFTVQLHCYCIVTILGCFCSVLPQYIYIYIYVHTSNLFRISVLRNKNITEDKNESFFYSVKWKNWLMVRVFLLGIHHIWRNTWLC